MNNLLVIFHGIPKSASQVKLPAPSQKLLLITLPATLIKMDDQVKFH